MLGMCLLEPPGLKWQLCWELSREGQCPRVYGLLAVQGGAPGWKKPHFLALVPRSPSIPTFRPSPKSPR